MNRAVTIRAAAIAIAVVVCLVTASPAQAYRRYGRSYSYASMRARQQQYLNQAANAQLNAAKQVLSAAESTGGGAQSKLDTALSKLRDEAQKFHEAQSTTRHAAKELAEIEQEILEEQKEDSSYTKAAKQVEAARKKLKDIQDRIESDGGVQVQLQGLSGAKLAETRDSILKSHADYLDAKAGLEIDAGELSRIRHELFQADKHWKEAADTLVQARKEESAAEQMTHSGSSGLQGMHTTIRNASEAAAFARAAMAQAEAVLRANGGSRYLNSSGTRNSSPGYKSSGT
jgi:myosin heavy subunit